MTYLERRMHQLSTYSPTESSAPIHSLAGNASALGGLFVLVVDDHAPVRRTLMETVKSGFPNAIMDEAHDVTEMLQKLSQRHWDVTILDIALPGRSGLDALGDIKTMRPKMPVLVVSMHDEYHYAPAALKAGASGYVMKNNAPDELISAVTTVMAGRTHVSRAVAERLGHGLAGVCE